MTLNLQHICLMYELVLNMVISSKYFRVTLILLLFHDHPNLMSTQQISGFVYPLWSRVAVRISSKQQFFFIETSSYLYLIIEWSIASVISDASYLVLSHSQFFTHTNHEAISHTFCLESQFSILVCYRKFYDL